MEGESAELASVAPFRVGMCSKPTWGSAKSSMVKHLLEVWEVMQWRSAAQAQRFAPHPSLRPELTSLAQLRFAEPIECFAPAMEALRMSPL